MRTDGIRALLLVVLVSACRSDREPSADRDPALAPQTDATVDIDSQRLAPQPGSLTERPASRRDTLVIGGTPEVVGLRLLRAPSGFAVPFSTYVPEDMSVEFDTASGIDRVTVGSRSSDNEMGEALMTIAIHPAGTTRLVVEDRVREFVVSRGPGIDETQNAEAPRWGEWAVQLSYPRSRDEWFRGSAVIAQYGPRYFHVIQLYPAEDGDAFAARFDAALHHWRWDDTGRMLTEGAGSAR